MEHDEHSSISNSGNLSTQQSSPFVHGDGDDEEDDDDDVQGLRKRFSFSSASSSSFNSPLDNPFEEDKGTGIGNSELHMMQTSPANDGVDFQALNKRSVSSSSISSLDDDLRDEEGHRDDSVGSLPMQPSLPLDGVDDQGFSKKFSRSSSLSSSSSSDSLFEGNFGVDEELRDKDSENLTMQHFPTTVDEVDHQDSRKSSRSTSSSPNSPLNGSKRNINSSPDSPLNGPFGEGNEKGKDASIGDLTMQPSPADDEVDVQAAGKLSRSSSSSSSSSDSPHHDPPGSKSVTSDTSLPELDHKAAVEGGKNDNPVSKNLPPKSELPVRVQPTEVTNFSTESNLGNISSTDSPPTQVMERTTKPKYRIPSHVFARNKSGNPDWSVASNDSLFSIHMGNMSFTRDPQLFSPGESFSASGQLVNQSANPLPGEPSHQQPRNKATNGESREPGKAEAAVETTEEVRKENETAKMSIPAGQISHHPQESSTSNKSFAFPVLADGEKSQSVRSGDSSRSSSGKERSDSQKVSSPKNPEESSEEAEKPEVKEAVGAQLGLGGPWLSCLPCCSRNTS